MRKVIRKLFWAWEPEKEEKWLNEMAAKGLALVGVGLCRFEFETCLPGEYQVRLEMLEHLPRHPESQQYIGFLEETGAEHVGSCKRWVYFRKKRADGPFDLFSDNASRIRHLRRILALVAVLPLPLLFTAGPNLYLFFAEDSWPNLVVGLSNLAIIAVAIFGACRLQRKIKGMKKEQAVFE